MADETILEPATAAQDRSNAVSANHEAKTQTSIGTEPSPVVPAGNNSQASDITPQAGGTAPAQKVVDLESVRSIKVDVQVVLGGFSLSVKELADLSQDQMIPLDTRVGDPVKILANGELIGLGEIVVLEEGQPKFGVVVAAIGKAADLLQELKARTEKHA